MLIFRSKIVLNEVRSNGIRAKKGKKIGRVRSGPKFCILLRAGSGSGRNFVLGPRQIFYVYFAPGRAGPGPDCSFCGRNPGMKNPACADLARVTLYNGLSSSLLMCEGLTNFERGGGVRNP